MSEPARSLQGYWFGAFQSNDRGRLLCAGMALVFLAFPLADLLSGAITGPAAVGAAAGLTAFAGLFLRLFWILPWAGERRRAESRALLALLAALATALGLAFGDEWLGLLVYLSVAGALTVPIRLALPTIAAVAVVALAIAGGFDSGSGLALQVLMFGLLIVAVRRLVVLVEELEATRERVAELAVSEERLRLSRDMHDLLGHNLSLIALKSELAGKLIGRDSAAAASEVRDVESVARASLREAREAVRGLRRASLAAELERARETLAAAGIDATLHSQGPLPAEVETLLSFAVREATTNVVRHSRARSCELAVRRSNAVAELEVRDDGVGAPEDAGDGSGLRGLAERMAAAGGRLETGPAPGGGFRVLASVPIPGQAAAETPDGPRMPAGAR